MAAMLCTAATAIAFKQNGTKPGSVYPGFVPFFMNNGLNIFYLRPSFCLIWAVTSVLKVSLI